MSFTIQNWSRWSTSANEPLVTLGSGVVSGAPRAYIYYALGVEGVSGDTQATIAGGGYFNSVNFDIQTGDFVYAFSVRDGSYVPYFFTNTNGVITTSAFSNVAPIGTANINNLAVTAAKIANNTITDAQVSLNGLTSLSLSTSLVQFGTGQLSAANIQAMYGAPIQLIAAAGANTLIVIDSFDIELAFNNVQFTTGGNVGLQYGNTAHLAAPAATTIFANAANNNICAAQSQVVGVVKALSNQTAAATVNTGIFISNDTAAFAAGNSVVNWYVRYHVVTTT